MPAGLDHTTTAPKEARMPSTLAVVLLLHSLALIFLLAYPLLPRSAHDDAGDPWPAVPPERW